MVHLIVEAAVRRRVAVAARRRLRRRMERALRAAGAAEGELSILLCGDATIRALNRRYAASDHPTDVLSFSQREGLWAPEERLLGDVAVSLETAARQARGRGGGAARALEAEILHLCVHGLAHLLGFDHDTPTRQQVMWAHEAVLRAQATGHGPVRVAQGGGAPPTKTRTTARRAGAAGTVTKPR